MEVKASRHDLRGGMAEVVLVFRSAPSLRVSALDVLWVVRGGKRRR
ncbi:hypothetical protein ABZ951_09500 [Streptomyces sp. NPDC046215]